MARRTSSARWLAEHHADEYVKKARELGYRSRAVFKLEELDAKHHLLRPGMTVVDLGAAPGGWSQYASRRLGRAGRIIALDILPMEAIPGVTFIQGDFREASVFEQLHGVLDGARVDLLLSDMAPNMSGMRAVDIDRASYLCELALDAARRMLRPGGGLVMKAFIGAGFDDLVRTVRQVFLQSWTRKPKASRGRSAETYLVAMGYKGD
jgi:23S rRNA (uridine2552-2'-O)-methyltransferase